MSLQVHCFGATLHLRRQQVHQHPCPYSSCTSTIQLNPSTLNQPSTHPLPNPPNTSFSLSWEQSQCSTSSKMKSEEGAML
ncbi:hypothetical protein BKA81DRAFT_352504, partial [Phyllosticta paracitricarpa]